MIARQFSARACGFMSQPLRTNRGLLLYEYLQARVFLVMEYCNGGDLHDAREQPTEGCLLTDFCFNCTYLIGSLDRWHPGVFKNSNRGLLIGSPACDKSLFRVTECQDITRSP